MKIVYFILFGLGGEVMLHSFADLLSYELHYPVEEWVMQQFKRRPNKKMNYFEFLTAFVSQQVHIGVRKHGEVEKEWYELKRLYMEQIDAYNNGAIYPTYNMYILLDQCLLLEHEGQHIPNLLR